MPRKPRLGVTREAESGRNLGFVDNRTGEQMTRAQFVKKNRARGVRRLPRPEGQRR